MSKRSGADVIVTADRDAKSVDRCVRSVLEESGPLLRRLIVIDDQWLDGPRADVLQRLVEFDTRVRLVRNSPRLGHLGSCNLGLTEREGDAVLLGSRCVVGRDWLVELAAVAHSEQRTACVSPLVNVAGTCSVPELNRDAPGGAIPETTVREACAGLPRWTVAPIVEWSCIYLRGDVIDAVGLLDPNSKSMYAAVNNWVARAQALGFAAKRANHAYVQRWSTLLDWSEEDAPFDAIRALLDQDDTHLEHQLERFSKTLDGHLAAHAVRVESTGKIRVAYDIRHLPRQQVGTRTYAVSLARCLGEIPDIELTVLVRDPAQARGLKGRVVTEEQWNDDVAVIHKPSQVTAPRELKLLFESSAHIVVTFLDLIGYRIPLAYPNDAEFDRYRATSGLSLPAVQRVLAISESARAEIAAEFGVPHDEIAVVPLGVEAPWFAHREPGDEVIRRSLGLPKSYFFSLATDFPHKNLPNLLDAFALLRSRWRDGDPPGLMLAGYASSARTGFYANLQSKPLGDGLTFLGSATRDQVRVLYQDALALVFPSLYEGFGLPPLEAMAAGTPVIAMPISSVPEVVGDACLCPDGLSIEALAQAMESVATDAALRDELIDRGRKRVEQFRWDKTARATADVYRSAVLRPSERSLHARCLLRDAIIDWSVPRLADPWLEPFEEMDPAMEIDAECSLGIRNASRALNHSLHARLRRELKRFQPGSGRANGPDQAPDATIINGSSR